jgi:hypothetical protein
MSANVATIVIFATSLEVVLRFRGFFTRTALAFLVIGCIGGCALAAKEGPMSSDTPSSTSNSRSSQEPSVTVLTEADSGRSVGMRVGDEVLLRLSHNLTWSDPTVEGNGVELAPVDYLVDPGFTEWRISATGPGIAVVTVAGTFPDSPTVRFEMQVSDH